MVRGLSIRVYGRVQGVHLRGSAQAAARNLELTGFARNDRDGSVELWAEGEEGALNRFLEWVQRGSLLAQVDRFEYQWKPASGKYQDFEVIRAGNLLRDQLRAFRNLGRRLLLPDPSQLPRHVVIVPDGNRRWAKERGLPSMEGHRQGLKRMTELADVAQDCGIHTMTIWGFSTENWQRDSAEKEVLFQLFRQAIRKICRDAEKKQIGFRHLGRRDRLPQDVVTEIEDLERETAGYDRYQLNLALDYGGRDEIMRGVRKALDDRIDSLHLDEARFSSYLDTRDVIDPDLIIRTSGEQRLSGILPWQGVYSELYFSPLHFPDFDGDAFRMALLDYSSRKRRFGR